jgi:glycosyltransferase involved in cell wall biosynthesis
MEPVAVVIPTLNEVGTIGDVIREIPPAFANDVIIADSGSTDGTHDAFTGLLYLSQFFLSRRHTVWCGARIYSKRGLARAGHLRLAFATASVVMA